MHKTSYFFPGHVLFPLFNCRVPMDRDHLLHRTYFVPPIKPRKEANMYKPFLCGKRYSGKKQEGPLRKATVLRMASFAFACLASLVSIHIPRNNSVLSPGSDLCSPTEDNLVLYPQVISGACYLHGFDCIVCPSFCCLWDCRFPILIIPSHDSPNFLQNPTCPRLTKAICLVSAAGAMGLFGGEKPDTVLSVKRE